MCKAVAKLENPQIHIPDSANVTVYTQIKTEMSHHSNRSNKPISPLKTICTVGTVKCRQLFHIRHIISVVYKQLAKWEFFPSRSLHSTVDK
jgi:hypothetical protein